MAGRVCIIGLDCLTPQLLFEEFLEDLPTFRMLTQQSRWGPLESCIPPITVPAWACMTTGYDPGTLGVYGFRGRHGHSVSQRSLASSMSFTQPPLWTRLSRVGITSRILGVPQTFPAKPLSGFLVTGCMTPPDAMKFTHPEELAADLNRKFGDFVFDVADFRHKDPKEVLKEIEGMTDQRFAIARDWLSKDDWRLFMMVDMGPDRMHHIFWSYGASDHRDFDPDHPLRHAVRDYYRRLDGHLAGLIGELDDDDLLWVVSDHGAKTMEGGVAINQWLQERGDLVLLTTPEPGGSLDPAEIDWGRTKAWGDGGYVGRIYFNIRGREVRGIIDAGDVDSYAESMRADLRRISDADGSWDTQVHRPEEIYARTKGTPPDLTILFDDLRQRSIGSMGHPSIYVRENDRGVDGANHAQHGVSILRDGKSQGFHDDFSLYDVAPTVLTTLGAEVPRDMLGVIR